MGEYLATTLASEVWGKEGIPANSPFPAPDSGIGEDAVRYFLRSGEHNFTLKNWEDLLDFARKHFLSK